MALCSSLEEAPGDLEIAPKVELKSKLHPEISIVFFDLEATGLEPNSEIIQIAAKHGDKFYNEYVIPTIPIPASITNLTGLSMTEGKKMHYQGSPVDGVEKRAACNNFIHFLTSVGGRVILIAHNCFGFDGPRMVELMDQQGMSGRFKTVVAGFSDSLPLFRRYLPHRRDRGFKQYKLVNLARDYLNDYAGAHSASGDVTTLEKLMTHEKIKITADDVIGSYQKVDTVRRYRAGVRYLRTA